MTSRRALVTGGAGFIGANLTRRLLEEGHDVHVLERPGGDGWRLDDVAVGRSAVDLTDPVAVDGIVARMRPEWVFHLAAHGGYSWQRDQARILSTNLVGTVILARAAASAGCSAFVHAGSSSEYGLKDHAPSEDEAPEPNSDYAVGKAAATLYTGYAGRSGGMRTATLRLYSVFGPWEDPRRLIPTLVAHALRGELPPLVDPEVARDFVYVTDAVDAFLRVASDDRLESGGIYNIGTGVQTTIREVVETARARLAVVAEPAWGSMASRVWDTGVWVADCKKAELDLGWRAQTNFDTGFARMVEWMRSRGAT